MRNKIIFIVLIQFVLAKNIYSQSASDTLLSNFDFIGKTQDFYKNLDHTSMKTNLLLNQGMILMDKAEEWYKGAPISTTPYKWLVLYNNLKESAIGEPLNLPEDSMLLLNNVINPNSYSTVIMSLLFYKVDYLGEKEVKNIIETGGQPTYNQFNLFAGSPLHKTFYNANVHFSYNPELFFSNYEKKEIELSVDLGDGLGYKKVNPLEKQVFKTQYKTVGEKSIRYKLIYKGKEYLSYSKIEILSLQLPPPSKSDPEIDLTYGDYYYVEGNDGVLNKPVIFVEGFDITGTTTGETLYTDWQKHHLIDHLTEAGYDCFFLNFTFAGRKLQKNANLILKPLIEGINEKKEGNYEGILIGESMGGVISRIALKEMEDADIDPQIGLYISYDSPHKGANIPPGIQFFAQDVNILLSPYLVYLSTLVEIFELIFGEDVPYIDTYNLLISKGARQLIINHIWNTEMHADFQEYLDGLGFPEKSRNVSFTNGSNLGTLQTGIMPGQQYAGIKLRAWLFYLEYSIFYSHVNFTGYTNLFQFFSCFYPPIYATHSYSFDNHKWANAPAGINSAYKKIAFLPVVSAIDLDQDIIDANGLCYYQEPENTQTFPVKRYLIANNEVPFDDIYSRKVNSNHLTQIKIDEYIEKNEIMFNYMYLQNREINKKIDFEAMKEVYLGKDVTNFQSKVIEPNNFTVKSNGDVSVKSENKITLKPGFETKPGAKFSARIVDFPFKGKSVHKKAIPEIQGLKYAYVQKTYHPQNFNKDDTFLWKLEGENTFFLSEEKDFFVPQDLAVGQYTLTLTLTDSLCSETITKVIEVLPKERRSVFSRLFSSNKAVSSQEDIVPSDDRVIAFPNPSKGIFYISTKNINSILLKIEVFDMKGNVVFSNSNIGKEMSRLSIDISDQLPGIYVVKLITNKDQQTYKIIKR